MNTEIKFETKKAGENIVVIEFVLAREISPEELRNINPPDPIENKFADKLVILSGRGPIWLYGFLIHFYHPVKAIAVFDPRLDGAVVVESHSKEYEVGQVVKI